MFRFGRSAETPPSVRWSQLLPLLEDDDRRAAVERDYPEAKRESFLQALQRVDSQAAANALASGRQLEAAEPLSRYPTIAVAGMLNSGKTSLVSTFLSPRGRARVLRGETNAQGTHRFVLWLPSRWREDSELWSLLMRRIGEALGQPPEMLSEQVDAAHRQYNNISGGEAALAVPLVATDEGLDQHGVGLLDCPDIVSDAAFGRGAPELRRELLRRAATLCSAFVVVTGAESIRDATLGDLLRIAAELMPGVPRLLAVNKVRPRQTPDSVWSNTRELVNHHRVDGLYAAYDYEVPGTEPFIPKLIDQPLPVDEEPLPVFFRVAEDPDDNPPAAIPEAQMRERLLIALPTALDHAELFHQVRVALENRLRVALWEQGVDRLTEAAETSQRGAQAIRQELLLAILDFFARREPGGKIAELRLHQSARIVRQLSQAFADAAPWYARYGMRLNSRLRRFWGSTNDLVRRFTPGKVAEDAAEGIRTKFREGKQGSLLTPVRLRDAITARLDLTDLPSVQTDEQLAARGERAIDRFNDEDFTSLDPQRLQAAVEEVWQKMPVRKKVKAGLTPLAIVFAAFGAALMVPIDFGGSGVLLAASLKELFLAAGVSLAGAAWGGGLAIVDVEQQAARQQVSNFLAVLSDTLGVPRWDAKQQPLQLTVGSQTVALPPPTIAQRVLPEETLVLWRLREPFLAELSQHLAR
ncbi:hypothetical protein SH139x_005169 [Planctomycetaceae bacterium SH139]